MGRRRTPGAEASQPSSMIRNVRPAPRRRPTPSSRSVTRTGSSGRTVTRRASAKTIGPTSEASSSACLAPASIWCRCGAPKVHQVGAKSQLGRCSLFRSRTTGPESVPVIRSWRTEPVVVEMQTRRETRSRPASGGELGSMRRSAASGSERCGGQLRGARLRATPGQVRRTAAASGLTRSAQTSPYAVPR